MAVITPTRTTWTSLAAGLIQPRGGPVRVAKTATPAADDFIMLIAGESLLAAETVYVQAASPFETRVVSLVL